MASPTGFQELRSDLLKSALANSTLDGQFTDTAYILYSRRFRDGKVGAPKRVYASSWALIGGGTHFLAQRCRGSLIDQAFPEEIDEYAYECDSDLDEDEDSECPGREEHTAAGDATEHEESRSENEEAESEGTIEGKILGNHIITTSSSEFADPRCRLNITVPDFAANTWRALVYYIYTGKISFAPLRSKGTSSRKNFIRNYRTIHLGSLTPVSPKSIYRLADMYEIDDLKKLAERDIKAKITAQNVVAEAFSWFSSEYPDILEFQLAFLFQPNILEQCMPAIRQKMKEALEGQLPHTGHLVDSLLDRLMFLSSAELPQSQRTATASQAGNATNETPVRNVEHPAGPQATPANSGPSAGSPSATAGNSISGKSPAPRRSLPPQTMCNNSTPTMVPTSDFTFSTGPVAGSSGTRAAPTPVFSMGATTCSKGPASTAASSANTGSASAVNSAAGSSNNRSDPKPSTNGSMRRT